MTIQASADERLAAQLDLPVEKFVELFGADWSTAPNDDGSDSSRKWHVAGDPPQLMLAVLDGDVILAWPRGRWRSVSELVLEAVDQQRLGPTDFANPDRLRAVVATLLRRRRSAFRYCAYCRRLTPPECWHDPACMGCASRWLGVVY